MQQIFQLAFWLKLKVKNHEATQESGPKRCNFCSKILSEKSAAAT